MVSPPKPWERAGAGVGTATAAAPPALSASTTSIPPPPGATISSTPSVPTRPAAFATPTMASTMGSVSPFGATNSALSPYNRLGTYGGYGGGGYGSTMGFGSSMGSMGSYGGYGGYGGYSGGYGGYGGGGYGSSYGGGMFGGGGMMGGYPGAYGQQGMPGMQVDALGNPIPTLTQTLEATTQHTFTLLHSIVQTFGGMAQMLDSTFMATHSSFFAMVGVIDQFAHLRNALGSVLGLFGLVNWMKELLTGKTGSTRQLKSEFKGFMQGKPVTPNAMSTPGSAPSPRASRKPLIVFLLAIFGIPYAMTKLIRVLQERAAQQQLTQPVMGPNGQLVHLPPLEPSMLTFARALYPFEASNPSELALKEDEIVAIMGKLDPKTGAEVDPRLEVGGSDADGEWWKGRTRDGREGWFPKKWVQVLERKKQPEEPKKVD